MKLKYKCDNNAQNDNNNFIKIFIIKINLF
jgi:hypothetical protein